LTKPCNIANLSVKQSENRQISDVAMTKLVSMFLNHSV